MAPLSLSGLFKKYTQKFFPKKSRKAIEDWDFIMVFDLLSKQELQQYFSNLECKQHVKFHFIEYQQVGKVLVLIGMDEHIIIDQAHELKVLKIKNKKSFAIFQSGKENIYQRIQQAKSANSMHYADYLCYIAARNLPGNERVKEQQRYSVFNKHKIDMYPAVNGSLFTSEQELRCKYNFLLTYRQKVKDFKLGQDLYEFPFVDIMKHKHFEEMLPIHKNSRYSPIILESVKDYVGPNDEIYFEFVSFLQKWLVFPAIIGIMTMLFNYFFEFSADDSPGDFVYSLLIMVWSIYFITSWENESRWLKTKEESGYNDQAWSEHQNIIDKNSLKLQISPVTGKQEWFLPFKQKFQFYFISIGTCFLFSLASIIWMIFSLNARGFVDPNHKLLYFESLSQWAAPGGIFDAQTWWGQVPNLVHVIVTNVFDQSVYRPMAKKLTKIERHLNNKTHSNSIIMKFFIYEFIITFADFFYIAFVRFDIEGLREQLLSLFFIDIVRRLVAQTIIPRFKNKYYSYTLKGSTFNKVPQNEELRHYAILEVNKEHFESFDDYLQIITNFGYLVLISSCFPLAPLLIILAHSVEILQDKYKLIHIYRRRLPQKFVGMGTWKSIIVFICYMSIVTNILLFAFSSQQIVSIFPQIFESGKDLVLGNTQFATLVGGAATGIFTSMIDLGSTAIDTLNVFTAQNVTQTFDNNTFLDNDGWGNYFENNTINDAVFDVPSSFVVHSFKPVPKQHEMEFIGILFLLEHIFLIGFILFRNFLSKRKSITDIFLERRTYKRKVKKYLSKDILAQNLRDEVVNKLITSKNHQDPLGFLGKLLDTTESTVSQDSESNAILQLSMKKTLSFQTGDLFTSLIQRLGQSAEKVIAGQSLFSQQNSEKDSPTPNTKSQENKNSIKIEEQSKKKQIYFD